MQYPSKETIQRLRETYPAGCQVILIRMEDKYAPPPGTQGEVRCVDDTGTIHVRWGNGSGLGVVYGVDEICRLVE